MNRFHNKYHRHNHHTLPALNEPDSSHDPIASPEDPFKGSFHILGQLSATSCVVSALTVHNDAIFTGNVTIPGPITNSYERLVISPTSTTTSYTFKINSTASTLPLAAFYANNSPKFFMQYNGNLGLGTNTPRVTLDVIGDISVNNISATSLSSSSYIYTKNLTATEDSHINGINITRENNTVYLNNIVLDTAIVFSTKTFGPAYSNLILSANNTNKFTGKLGIGIDINTPFTNTVAISGDLGFQNNGYIVFDNTYNNTLRIINKKNLPDDQQNSIVFNENGNTTIGRIPFNMVYNCLNPRAWNRPDMHKINAFIQDANSSLSLTVLNTSLINTGPTIRTFRLNGDIASQTSVLTDQEIGAIRAYAYNPTNGFSDLGNAAIQFYSNNIQSNISQGSYITFSTTNSSDINCTLKERFKIHHNGNITVNSSDSHSAKMYIAADSSNTAGLFIKSPGDIVSGFEDVGIAIHSGGIPSITKKTALYLNDTNTNINNYNQILFNTDSKLLAGIACLHTATSTDTGGDLIFYNTPSLSIAGSTSESVRFKHDSTIHIGGYNSNTNARLCVNSNRSEAIEAYSNTGECKLSLYTRPGSLAENVYDPTNITVSTSRLGNAITSRGKPLSLTVFDRVEFKNASTNAVFSYIGLYGNKLFGQTEGNFTSSSDIKLKQNITPLTDSLLKIDLIRGVKFNWVAGNNSDVGVIAQEIENILPEAVFETKEGYKTVSYDKIIPLLIECVKDLKKEIKEIKNSLL